MGSRDCPYPVRGDAWFEKKKDQTLIWIPRPLPEQWSQTLGGAGARNLHFIQRPKASQGAQCEHHPGVRWVASPPRSPPMLNAGDQTAGP